MIPTAIGAGPTSTQEQAATTSTNSAAQQAVAADGRTSPQAELSFLPPVVDYHGLARRHVSARRLLMRPHLNGGTFARREACRWKNPLTPQEETEVSLIRSDAEDLARALLGTQQHPDAGVFPFTTAAMLGLVTEESFGYLARKPPTSALHIPKPELFSKFASNVTKARRE